MPAAPNDKPDGWLPDAWLAGASALKGPVLMVILERPGHAHDVAKRVRQRMGAAWANQLADVYPLLKRLEKKGLLRGCYEPNPHKPGDQVYVYHPTELTAAAVLAWRSAPLSVEPECDELLAMLAVAREEDAPELLRRFEEFERGCSQSSPALDQEIPTDSWLGMRMELIRKAVVSRRKAKVEWAEEARSWIEERQAPGA
ncbi:MAG TPA: PadR family transcriptional regulator [Solirubrobacteraceae bacterium]|nr:PadR family transcriptional regulator [Solirubrobacteraceae bacterium]